MFKPLPAPNRKIGYIVKDLPEEFHSLMDDFIDVNHTLSLYHHLTQSYAIELEGSKFSRFREFVIDLGLELDMCLENQYNNLSISKFWINYQAKTIFNPPHDHAGDFSFVIWYKIPYSIHEEKNRFPKALDLNTVGEFSFIYEGEYFCNQEFLPVDKSWEKRICIFPAKLQHQVFPFYTSDEYRITFAGNLISKEGKS